MFSYIVSDSFFLFSIVITSLCPALWSSHGGKSERIAPHFFFDEPKSWAAQINRNSTHGENLILHVKFISQLNFEDERQMALNLALKATWNWPLGSWILDLTSISIILSSQIGWFAPLLFAYGIKQVYS